MVEHRCCGYQSTENESEAVFPEACQEAFIREDERRQENDQNKRGDPEGDVRVESKAENQP